MKRGPAVVAEGIGGVQTFMTCRFEIAFYRSNISEANENSGSQTGSQQWQTPGDSRPHLATVGAASRVSLLTFGI